MHYTSRTGVRNDAFQTRHPKVGDICRCIYGGQDLRSLGGSILAEELAIAIVSIECAIDLLKYPPFQHR